MNAVMQAMRQVEEKAARAHMRATGALRQLGEGGQGTTEYAILVGVLVVIAIIAIAAFRGNISDLWEAIRDNINDLEAPTSL